MRDLSSTSTTEVPTDVCPEPTDDPADGSGRRHPGRRCAARERTDDGSDAPTALTSGSTTAASGYVPGSADDAQNARLRAQLEQALAARGGELKQGQDATNEAVTTVYYDDSQAPSFAYEIAQSASIWNSSVSNVRLVEGSPATLDYYEGNDPAGSYAYSDGHGNGYVFLDYAQNQQYDSLRVTTHETGHVLGPPGHLLRPVQPADVRRWSRSVVHQRLPGLHRARAGERAVGQRVRAVRPGSGRLRPLRAWSLHRSASGRCPQGRRPDRLLRPDRLCSPAPPAGARPRPPAVAPSRCPPRGRRAGPARRPRARRGPGARS